VTSAAGFGRFQDNEFHWALDSVHAPGFTLRIAEHASYTYPTDGWYYFSSRAEAETFFEINGRSQANWTAFRQAIFTENGYVDAHALALKSDNNLIRFAATALFDTLRAFENTGNWAEYLQALLLTVSALPPAGQAALAEEFIELAQRCHLPAAFITGFQQAIIPPGNLE
jgi:hypothetical protein